MNAITKDYPELSEWFQTPQEPTREEWSSVEVNVPTPGEYVQLTNQPHDAVDHPVIHLTTESDTEVEPINVDEDESPANTPPDSVQHIGGSFQLQSRMIQQDNVEAQQISVINQQQENAGNRQEIRVNLNQPTEIQEIRVITPQELTTKSQADRDVDCQVISDTAMGITDLNQNLNSYKKQLGCKWGQNDGCSETCLFVRTVLGLDQVPYRFLYKQQPTIQKVMIVRQTPEGLVKFTQLPIGSRQFFKGHSVKSGDGSFSPVYLAPVNSYPHPTVKAQPVQLESRPMGTGVFSSNHNKYSSLTTANHIQNRQTTTMQQQYNITQQHVQLQYNQNVNLQHGMQYSSANSPASSLDDGSHLSGPLPSPGLSAASPSLPTPSPSPPADGAEYTALMTSSSVNDVSQIVVGSQFVCSDCGTTRNDQKSLIKHKRNTHQIYICKECGDQNVGYYQMATHTKKMHQKEPVYFCECGRNFSEKKGLTKHQNTCTYMKKIIVAKVQ